MTCTFLLALFDILIRSIPYSCNNSGQCDISAEEFDFGPNPCPDTERYLEVSYVCIVPQKSSMGERFFWIPTKALKSFGGYGVDGKT